MTRYRFAVPQLSPAERQKAVAATADVVAGLAVQGFELAHGRSLRGGVWFVSPPSADEPAEGVLRFVSVSLQALAEGSGLDDGSLHVYGWSGAQFVRVEKPYAALVGCELVSGGQCPVPEVYRWGGAADPAALVLLLRFRDDEVVPVTYAVERPGGGAGSRVYLEAFGATLLAQRPAWQALSAERQRQAVVARGVPARPGYRGARLGEPYELAWVDQEPTEKTWAELADRRGCFGVILAFIITLVVCVVGGFGWIVFMWLFGFVALVGGLEHWFRSLGRQDKEPVPKPVRREAFIEHAEGGFHFVLTVEGVPEIWQPWERVTRFVETDYWSTFADSGKSPYEAAVHAIAMYPAVGRPWLVAKTMEAKANVYERWSELDTRFSQEARDKFMRALETAKDGARSPGPAPKPQDVPDGFD